MDQLIAVTSKALESRSGAGRRQGRSRALGLVRDLDAFLELVVQVVREVERVVLVGLEQATRAALDMHEVDRDIQVEEIVDQGILVMARLLKEHKALLEGDVGVEAVNQLPQALPRVGEPQDRTALEAFMALQKRRRDETGHMLLFADVDAYIERFMRQHGPAWAARLMKRCALPQYRAPYAPS